MPTGLGTLRAAPKFDRLRTVQSMAPPPISIIPAFNTLARYAATLAHSSLT
jgi:hypothetical protein